MGYRGRGTCECQGIRDAKLSPPSPASAMYTLEGKEVMNTGTKQSMAECANVVDGIADEVFCSLPTMSGLAEASRCYESGAQTLDVYVKSLEQRDAALLQNECSDDVWNSHGSTISPSRPFGAVTRARKSRARARWLWRLLAF